MDTDQTHQEQPPWQPLPPIERRIVGVLVEKAKTTPEGYPLSLNALKSGCNQKSNRSPLMNVEADEIEDALEHLRMKGAVAEILGGGRVSKYRHYLKDWLGVDGPELAVITELLLRGIQTVGELRGRAARMAPIADVAALRPILQSLTEKGLLTALTPEGRGQIVAHTLYEPRELERLRAEHGSQRASVAVPATSVTPAPSPSPAAPAFEAPPPPMPAAAPAPTAGSTDGQALGELRQEVAQLRGELEKLRKDVEDIWANLR